MSIQDGDCCTWSYGLVVKSLYMYGTMHFGGVNLHDRLAVGQKIVTGSIMFASVSGSETGSILLVKCFTEKGSFVAQH